MKEQRQTGIQLLIALTITASIVGVAVKPESAIPIFGFAGVICAQLFTRLSTDKKLDEVADKAEIAAVRVGEVKTTLAKTDIHRTDQLNQIQQVGEDVHKLVNGALTASMKIGAVALRRLADNTEHPGDITAAELAEKALKEHIAKQRINGFGTGESPKPESNKIETGD